MGNGDASAAPVGPSQHAGFGCSTYPRRSSSCLLSGCFTLLFVISLSSPWPPSKAPFFVSASVYLSSCLSRPFPCPAPAKRTLESGEQPWRAIGLPGLRRGTASLAGAEGAGDPGEYTPSSKSEGIWEGKTQSETFGSLSVWTSSGQGDKWQE